MKKINFLFLMLVSACSTYYLPAPYQNLPQLPADKPTVNIKIINKTGGNVEFYRGYLKGLILGPREYYIAKLPLGYQKHKWSQVVLHKDRVYHYGDTILVTHNSKILKIIPPPRDDLFRTRGRGCLDLKDR